MKSAIIKVSAGVLAVATTAFALLYHGHTYDRTWEHSEIHHWKRATCGCDEISGLEEHSVGDDGFCWICDRPLSPTADVEYAVSENEQKARVVRFFGGIDKNRVNISSEYKNLPVTELGEGAFESLDTLTMVILPASITSIGVRAFFGCSALTDLQIQGEITTIEQNAFYGCTKLSSFEIPKTAIKIGEFAFAECDELTSVSIPSGITSLSRGLFTGCDKLTEVTIGDNVTEIGESAFAHCLSLENVRIPDGVRNIGYGAFNNCRKLKSVILPKSLLTIGELAFDVLQELCLFYAGKAEDWQKVEQSTDWSGKIYFYSEKEPALNEESTAYDGNYWRYENGEPKVWEYKNKD
jgi:hypothetical protein